MNANEINNLDPEDIGLKQIMGNRFHDATRPTMEPITTNPSNTTNNQGRSRPRRKWQER